jgi:hypothetical protein
MEGRQCCEASARVALGYIMRNTINVIQILITYTERKPSFPTQATYPKVLNLTYIPTST